MNRKLASDQTRKAITDVHNVISISEIFRSCYSCYFTVEISPFNTKDKRKLIRFHDTALFHIGMKSSHVLFSLNIIKIIKAWSVSKY